MPPTKYKNESISCRCAQISETVCRPYILVGDVLFKGFIKKWHACLNCTTNSPGLKKVKTYWEGSRLAYNYLHQKKDAHRLIGQQWAQVNESARRQFTHCRDLRLAVWNKYKAPLPQNTSTLRKSQSIWKQRFLQLNALIQRNNFY